jgi:GT2 family glycosyltransferase
MKLSIVIVNYNSKDLLLPLLGSIYQNTKQKEIEIIVVDNGSGDGSVEAIRAAHKDVIILANPRNLGFSTAVNQGIKAGSGEYVLLLNPDVYVRLGAIDVMLRFMEDHSRAGAVGCKMLNPDGSVQASGKSFPDPMVMLFVTLGLHKLFPKNPVTSRYYHPTEDYNKPHEVEHLMAACLMVRRSVIDKVGLMDENFFLYCEDVDWSFRIHQAGHEIWYIPDAEVVHTKGGATSKESYRGIIEYHKSAWYFYKKYYYGRYPKLLSLLFYIGLQVRKLWFLAANFVRKDKKVNY